MSTFLDFFYYLCASHSAHSWKAKQNVWSGDAAFFTPQRKK